MSSTKIFSLEGKGLKLDTAADIEPHLQPLVSSSDVEEARFGGNTYGIEACAKLAEVLKSKQTLKIVNLADAFTGRLLSEIPPSLTSLLTACLSLPNLHTINLNDNAFGLNTVEPLRIFLSSHTPLQHLILNNNGLGPRAGTIVADALTELASKKKETDPLLETVVCGRNRLESGSMAAWAKAFAAHKGVKEVRMIQNGIRPEGIALVLSEGLKHASSLQVLSLQDNTFTIKGSTALATVLPGWTSLKELDVGDCLLSARGSVLALEALGKDQHKDLEVLRLQYNDITVKGVEALKGALDALPKLRRVELNGNKFSEEEPALESIRETLEERKTDEDAKEEDYGLDSLSDLEDDSDEEEEGDEEDEEKDEEGEEEEELKESVLKGADQAANENVAQEKDASVDSLAEKLGKTIL